MDALLTALGGLILLVVCLRLPQWVANKTGKTIRIRGILMNYVNYKPNELKKAKQQLKEASDHLEKINQRLYNKHNSDFNDNDFFDKLTNQEKEEYIRFPLSLRAQLQIAIKEHIVITDFSDASERLKIKPWLVKYQELYETLMTVNVNGLTTLIYGEYFQIEQFMDLYQKAFNSIVEQGHSENGLNFI